MRPRAFAGPIGTTAFVPLRDLLSEVAARGWTGCSSPATVRRRLDEAGIHGIGPRAALIPLVEFQRLPELWRAVHDARRDDAPEVADVLDGERVTISRLAEVAGVSEETLRRMFRDRIEIKHGMIDCDRLRGDAPLLWQSIEALAALRRPLLELIEPPDPVEPMPSWHDEAEAYDAALKAHERSVPDGVPWTEVVRAKPPEPPVFTPDLDRIVEKIDRESCPMFACDHGEECRRRRRPFVGFYRVDDQGECVSFHRSPVIEGATSSGGEVALFQQPRETTSRAS